MRTAVKGETEVEVSEWVPIRIESRDGKWKSIEMRAKVVHHLIRPVILGIPFLCAHRLIHDFGSGTLIDPASGHDLLVDLITPAPELTPPSKPTEPAQLESPSPPSITIESKATKRKEKKQRKEETKLARDVKYFSIVPKQSAGKKIKIRVALL